MSRKCKSKSSNEVVEQDNKEVESKEKKENKDDKKNKKKHHSKVKDAVFRAYFKEEETAVSLYYALTKGRVRLDPTGIRILELPETFDTDYSSDVAFITKDGKLVVLCEHQSTANKNMPLRFLIYYVEYLKTLVKSGAIYATKLVNLPEPEFYVAYNGAQVQPVSQEMYLHDAFASKSGEWIDLKVVVHNISLEQNSEIVTLSQELHWYSEFITRMRIENPQTKREAQSAVRKIAEEFLREGKMVEFLADHLGEVVNVLTAKWSAKKAMKVAIQEALEDQAGAMKERAEAMAQEQAEAKLQERLQQAEAKLQERLRQEEAKTKERWEKASKKLTQKAMKKGEKKGKKEGEREGIFKTQLNSIRTLINKFKCSLEEAMESLCIPVAERATYRAALL